MTQLRLLRFLQERTFYPVGSDTPMVVDTRVITATNVNLKEKVQQGTFREDLYFRLRVIDISLPPLRKRNGDIVMLANHFVRKFSQSLKKPVNGLSDNAIALLLRHDWPGNVRELEHVMERAVVLCPGVTITSNDLPQELARSNASPEPVSELQMTQPPAPAASPTGTASAGVETDAHVAVSRILSVLGKCGGNKAKAARLLGIDRSTLYRKIKEYHIDLSVISLE